MPAAVGSVAAGDGNAPPGHRSPAVNFSGRGAAPPPSTTTLVRPPHWYGMGGGCSSIWPLCARPCCVGVIGEAGSSPGKVEGGSPATGDGGGRLNPIGSVRGGRGGEGKLG